MRKEEVKRNKISLNCSIYNYISEFVFKENKNKKDYEILIEELENFDSNEINDNENILLVFKLNVLINYLNETYNDKIDEKKYYMPIFIKIKSIKKKIIGTENKAIIYIRDKSLDLITSNIRNRDKEELEEISNKLHEIMVNKYSRNEINSFKEIRESFEKKKEDNIINIDFIENLKIINNILKKKDKIYYEKVINKFEKFIKNY